MQFKDKTIIITGASSGIGAATATLLAGQGANLVLGARRGGHLDRIVQQINQVNGAAVALSGDVCDPDYAAQLVTLAEDRFGGLDGAFNNAGMVGEMAPVADTSAATWHSVIATNLTAGFHAARAQIPALTRRGGGSLVFTGSFVGHTVGLPGMGAYAAAKAGLVGLVQVLAVENAPAGIRANALLPGGTLTEMAGTDPAAWEWAAGLHALKRLADPDEIARVAAFLLSDDASFVTGSAMLADGGNSICKT